MSAGCIRHPNDPAVATCKACDRPVCTSCASFLPGGPFCSAKCMASFEEDHGAIESKDFAIEDVIQRLEKYGAKKAAPQPQADPPALNLQEEPPPAPPPPPVSPEVPKHRRVSTARYVVKEPPPSNGPKPASVVRPPSRREPASATRRARPGAGLQTAVTIMAILTGLAIVLLVATNQPPADPTVGQRPKVEPPKPTPVVTHPPKPAPPKPHTEPPKPSPVAPPKPPPTEPPKPPPITPPKPPPAEPPKPPPVDPPKPPPAEPPKPPPVDPPKPPPTEPPKPPPVEPPKPPPVDPPPAEPPKPPPPVDPPKPVEVAKPSPPEPEPPALLRIDPWRRVKQEWYRLRRVRDGRETFEDVWVKEQSRAELTLTRQTWDGERGPEEDATTPKPSYLLLEKRVPVEAGDRTISCALYENDDSTEKIWIATSGPFAGIPLRREAAGATSVVTQISERQEKFGARTLPCIVIRRQEESGGKGVLLQEWRSAAFPLDSLRLEREGTLVHDLVDWGEDRAQRPLFPPEVRRKVADDAKADADEAGRRIQGVKDEFVKLSGELEEGLPAGRKELLALQGRRATIETALEEAKALSLRARPDLENPASVDKRLETLAELLRTLGEWKASIDKALKELK